MPHRPRRLDLCDAVGNGIEMVPGAPLPDSLPCRSQLDEVRRIHLAGFGLRLGEILARSHLGFLHSSFDALGYFVGYLAHAIQQHVAIAQQNAVVVLAGVAHFPEYFAAPVRFQGYTTFEREATEEVVLRIASVVVQRSALSQIAGKAWRIRHVPRVDYLAL